MWYYVKGVHYPGIMEEEKVTKWLNEEYKKGKNPLQLKDPRNAVFVHKGGTKTAADIMIVNKDFLTISVKEKELKDESKINGTFDLINTSNKQIIKNYVDINKLENFRKYVISKKSEGLKSLPKKHPLREEYLNKINESFIDKMDADASNTMKYIEDLFLCTNFLLINFLNNKKNISTYYGRTLVNNKKQFSFLEGGRKFVMCKGRGRGSRAIKEIDPITKKPMKKCLFRVRVVLNNGLTPLLGLSSNKSSNWCIKIQVEVNAIYEILKKMDCINGIDFIKNI